MPRKNPLPPAELKIGERVRVLRERLGFSRADFARQIGIDSSVIADIELGRTPLRFHVAVRLSARFWVNPRWLATGFLPVNFQINFYGQRYQLAPKSLFSRAYAEVLSVPVEKALAAQAAKANCRVEDLDSLFQRKVGSIAPDSPDAIAERNRRIVQWAGNILGLLPPDLHEEFLKRITSASDDFFREHETAIGRLRSTLASGDSETPVTKRRKK